MLVAFNKALIEAGNQPPETTMGGSQSGPALTFDLTFMAALLPVSFFRHICAEI